MKTGEKVHFSPVFQLLIVVNSGVVSLWGILCRPREWLWITLTVYALSGEIAQNGLFYPGVVHSLCTDQMGGDGTDRYQNDEAHFELNGAKHHPIELISFLLCELLG